MKALLDTLRSSSWSHMLGTQIPMHSRFWCFQLSHNILHFFILQPNIMILVLEKLISRLEDVQIPRSMLKSLCRLALDLQSKTTLST